MKWRPYPAYKPSGVEWLGDVPEHWEVKRGRFCMYVNPRSNKLRLLDSDDEVSFVPMEAIGEYGGLQLGQTRSISDVGSGYTEFDNGDVIVAKITPCFENGKGSLATGLKNGAAFGTTEIHILRAQRELDRRLLFYLTISSLFRSQGEGIMYGAGGQKRVSPEFCKDFHVPLPPLHEQTAIAGFLDRETGRIDTLVAKKQTLIERLKEKRTALISRTVTRGLPPDAASKAGFDPHPRLKPSGVEWLGDVPEHWGTCPLKYFATIKTGYAFSSDDFTEKGTPILRIGDITQDGQIDFSNAKYLPNSYNAKHRDVLVKYGDIVMAMTGATIGKAGRFMFDEPALLNQRVCIFRPINQNDQSYLWYILNTTFYIEHINLTAFGGAQPNISDSELLDCFIPVPPTSEQTAIADFLDRETAKIDRLITKIETAIERLREYRTALISAAVTGKIDVRGEAKIMIRRGQS